MNKNASINNIHVLITYIIYHILGGSSPFISLTLKTAKIPNVILKDSRTITHCIPPRIKCNNVTNSSIHNEITYFSISFQLSHCPNRIVFQELHSVRHRQPAGWTIETGIIQFFSQILHHTMTKTKKINTHKNYIKK
jgi:hypothetical protein